MADPTPIAAELAAVLAALRGEIAAMRAEAVALRGTNRSLAAAGRGSAEALAAADAAAETRHRELVTRLTAMEQAIADVKPAADYFAGRAKAEGAAEGAANTAGKQLEAATKGAAAAVLANARVRALLTALAIATLMTFAGWLGLATGKAGEMQRAYNATPDAQEAQTEPP